MTDARAEAIEAARLALQDRTGRTRQSTQRDAETAVDAAVGPLLAPVRALHRREQERFYPWRTTCTEDGEDWPCCTTKALDATSPTCATRSKEPAMSDAPDSVVRAVQELLTDAAYRLDELCPHCPDDHAEGTCEVCDLMFAASTTLEDAELARKIADAAWEKWQACAAERDTSAGLREALERLLEFPNWTYIDGVLTAVVLPEDLRAVLSAHPADAPAGEEELTRYDPHPQDYDDARTFGPVDAERRPHDGMPHRGSCGDCGALLTVPNVVGTTQPDATVLRASDETGPGVPEGGGGLRGALEALADQWAWILYSREGLPLREDDFDRGWNAAMACDLTRLRAVLATHPADAPAEAPEPSGDVVEQVARVLGARTEPLCGECSVPGSSTDTLLCGACDARALADAGLLADPAETERRENVAKAWAERWLGERDRARDLAADLEADNARLTEALREIQAAIGLPAVVCGQVSMPVRYEKARKAADAALSDGATR